MARKRHLRRIPKGRTTQVSREEYNALVDILNERAKLLAQIQHTLDIQFQRMAQMQVQLDEVATVRGRSLTRPSPSGRVSSES